MAIVGGVVVVAVGVVLGVLVVNGEFGGRSNVSPGVVPHTAGGGEAGALAPKPTVAPPVPPADRETTAPVIEPTSPAESEESPSDAAAPEPNAPLGRAGDAEDPVAAVIERAAMVARAGDEASFAQAESLLRDALGRATGEQAAALEGELRFLQIRRVQASLKGRL